MKTIRLSLAKACLLLVAGLLHATAADAATQREASLLEAAENVQIASQQIAKAYFYVALNTRPERAAEDLKAGLASLDRDISILTDGVEDPSLRNLILFISFNRDELHETLAKPFSNENGAVILDFSESLLEGAEAIARTYTDPNDTEESMLLVVEKMDFLLERMSKYYIAFQAGFRDENNVRQIVAAAAQFDTLLPTISAYSGYPEDLKTRVRKLNKYWPIAKGFYLDVKNSSLPETVFISSDYMESTVRRLEKYHFNQIAKSE